MELILARDPLAFTSKLKSVENSSVSHIKGCNCKKSNCLKKYCECFCAGVKCGDSCKCDDCKNGCDHEKPSKSEKSEETEEEKASPILALEVKEATFSTEDKLTTVGHLNEECNNNSNSKLLEIETQPPKTSFKKFTPNRIKLYRGGGGNIQKKNQESGEKRGRDDYDDVDDGDDENEEDSSSDVNHSPEPIKKFKTFKSQGESAKEDKWTEKKIKQELTNSKLYDGKMTPFLRGNEVKKNLFDEFKTPTTKGKSERPQRTTRRSSVNNYAKTTRKGR